MEVGDKVDVRDTEYIWCVGQVKIKIESSTKDPLLVIHYEGWNKYFDEIISQTSVRVAPKGTYTNRLDIPKYALKTENSMQGQIVNRITTNNSPNTVNKNEKIVVNRNTSAS